MIERLAGIVADFPVQLFSRRTASGARTTTTGWIALTPPRATVELSATTTSAPPRHHHQRHQRGIATRR